MRSHGNVRTLVPPLQCSSPPRGGFEQRAGAFAAAEGVGSARRVVPLTLLFIGTRAATPGAALQEFPVGAEELRPAERGEASAGVSGLDGQEAAGPAYLGSEFLLFRARDGAEGAARATHTRCWCA